MSRPLPRSDAPMRWAMGTFKDRNRTIYTLLIIGVLLWPSIADVTTGGSGNHLVSTAASSTAWQAPCARNGSIACAASPSSATRPMAHVCRGSRSYSAHRCVRSLAAMIVRTSECQPANSASAAATSPVKTLFEIETENSLFLKTVNWNAI